MPIVVNLDVMMAKRKVSLNALSKMAGKSCINLSILKTGKARAIRFSMLNAICTVLDCQPSDILKYVDETTYEYLYPGRKWEDEYQTVNGSK